MNAMAVRLPRATFALFASSQMRNQPTIATSRAIAWAPVRHTTSTPTADGAEQSLRRSQQLAGTSTRSWAHLQQRPQRHQHTCRVWPFDTAWGVSVDTQTLIQKLPQDLFAISLFPYLAFLFFLTRSRQTPPLTLFGFYFLLAFVGASIPAGIIAKQQYHTTLANVDWLHGGAESLLTVTNLLIVLGMRGALREAQSSQPVAATNLQQDPAAEDGRQQAQGKQPASARKQ